MNSSDGQNFISTGLINDLHSLCWQCYKWWLKQLSGGHEFMLSGLTTADQCGQNAGRTTQRPGQVYSKLSKY